MTNQERRLRIGVVGCGPIAQIAHLPACRKARNAELYAVCDVAADLAEKMAALHDPRMTYTDYDAMLADPEVEAVIVAVSDAFHVPLCLKAIAAGKHVLVEKPLGTTVEECEELRARVRGTRLVVQVGTNRRFDPGIAFAQRFVREEMGALISLRAWYCDSVYRYTMTDNVQPPIVATAHARRPDEDSKRDRRRYFMLAHGSHLVDTARFLGGEIEAVRARFLHRADSYCWSADVEYTSGCLGHLDLLIPARGDFEEGFHVYGTGGSAKCRTYLPWFHKASDVECFSARDGQYHRPLGADAYTYKLQIEGFTETILRGVPQHGANIDDGVAGMRAMAAIARSAESGERIRLADVTGGV